MATYTSVQLRIPEAKLLADLVGVKMDLQRANEFCNRMISEWCNPPQDYLLLESLSIAATVSYARAFSGGVRVHLMQDDLNVLSPEQITAHNFLLAYRNKHVAHSVNEFEENFAKAQYCAERVQHEGFTSITHSSGRIVTLGGPEITAMVEITEVLEAHVEEKIENERMRLLPIVRALPVESVLKGDFGAFKPKLSNVAKQRKSL